MINFHHLKNIYSMVCLYKQIGFLNNFQPFSVCPVTPLRNFSTLQSVFVPRYNGRLSPLVYTVEMVDLYAVLTDHAFFIACMDSFTNLLP